MFYKKIKGPRLHSRKEFIFLQVPAGRIKWSCWPDPARGPYVAHAWLIQISAVLKFYVKLFSILIIAKSPLNLHFASLRIKIYKV